MKHIIATVFKALLVWKTRLRKFNAPSVLDKGKFQTLLVEFITQIDILVAPSLEFQVKPSGREIRLFWEREIGGPAKVPGHAGVLHVATQCLHNWCNDDETPCEPQCTVLARRCRNQGRQEVEFLSSLRQSLWRPQEHTPLWESCNTIHATYLYISDRRPLYHLLTRDQLE